MSRQDYKKILVLGSGAREHAFVYKLAQRQDIQIYVAPGNAGTSLLATNVLLNTDNHNEIISFCILKDINLILIGPEKLLAEGLVESLKNNPKTAKIGIIGPSQKGALLESSKDYAKYFMKKYLIPTARYATFTKDNFSDAEIFLETLKPPYVLKADGLAGGKGVLILDSIKEAIIVLKQMIFEQKFGVAGKKVIIEEFLKGIEVSCFVLTNGLQYLVLPAAKDYKRIGEQDTGLNTGGMGAISPPPFLNDKLQECIKTTIIDPTIKGIQKEGIDYIGFIFFGLMIVDNKPYVIEYNVRMGDPETEVVLPRLQTDFLDLLEATINKTLDKIFLQISTQACATVMVVAKGYPEVYPKGGNIKLPLLIPQNSWIFHAGTTQKKGQLISDGGRVLTVTSMAPTLELALTQTYQIIKKIHFKAAYYRKDIGQDIFN